MATHTEPATDALFQALSSPNPDPKVVHAAIEEVRQIASQNVIAVLGAKIDSQGAELRAEIKAQTARIDAMGSRIDILQRVIGPLIGLLAAPVFGLLYRIDTEADWKARWSGPTDSMFPSEAIDFHPCFEDIMALNSIVVLCGT